MAEQVKTVIKKGNLVVLMYAPNNCYTNVIKVDRVKDKEFKVDLENRVWSFQDWKDVPIGRSRSPYDNHSYERRDGIIGVYDRTNTGHLNSLAHAVKTFTESDSSPVDD